VQQSGGYIQVVDSRLGTVLFSKVAADTTSVTVNSAAGVSTTFFADSSVKVPVTFVGTNMSGDTLLGPNVSVASWNITGANAGTVGQVSFSNIGTLYGNAGSDAFIMNAGASLSGSIVNHSGGADWLDYSNWRTGVTVDLSQGIATGVHGGAVNSI